MSENGARGAGRAGVRVHAALVHVPVSAFAGAAVLELTVPFRESVRIAGVDVAAATIALIWAGLACAALAAVAGLVEFSRLPERREVTATANRHMLLMGCTFVCFLLLGLAHPSVAVVALPPGPRLGLSALGLCLLLAGGHLGGRLVALQRRE